MLALFPNFPAPPTLLLHSSTLSTDRASHLHVGIAHVSILKKKKNLLATANVGNETAGVPRNPVTGGYVAPHHDGLRVKQKKPVG